MRDWDSVSGFLNRRKTNEKERKHQKTRRDAEHDEIETGGENRSRRREIINIGRKY